MKNVIKLSCLGLLLVVMQSCTSDDDLATHGKSTTVFRFSITEGSAVNDVLIPEDAKLKLNVETVDGEPVLSDFTVNFQKEDDAFITDAVDLNAGEYVVTNFEIVRQDHLLYLAPDKSLSNIKSLRYILPLKFRATNSQRQQVDLQILSARAAGMENSFKLAVYAVRGGRWKLSQATAYMLDGPDTLATYALTASINRVPFTLDPAASYTLVIRRPGSARESIPFRYNDLARGVIRVELDPALTILGYTEIGLSTEYVFSLQSDPGSISIDWGDGTTQDHTFVPENPWDNFFSHEYANEGNHFITVTGDLHKINYFYSFYGHGMFDDVSFEHLSNLKEVRIGLTRGPKKIDLSKNLKIEFVHLPGVPELKDLKIPAVNYISQINISGPNSMNMPEVSNLVNNIYNNAVAHGTTGGFFDVSGSWWSEPGAPMFVGPPSAAARTKLTILRNSYGWEVNPDF